MLPFMPHKSSEPTEPSLTTEYEEPSITDTTAARFLMADPTLLGSRSNGGYNRRLEGSNIMEDFTRKKGAISFELLSDVTRDGDVTLASIGSDQVRDLIRVRPC